MIIEKSDDNIECFLIYDFLSIDVEIISWIPLIVRIMDTTRVPGAVEHVEISGR